MAGRRLGRLSVRVRSVEPMSESPQPIKISNQSTIYDLCLHITGGFEGTTFSTVTGNFDFQGISCGILQFNLGQGSLQNYILNHVDLMAYDYFPLPINNLHRMNPNDAVTWAKDNMMNALGELLPNWRSAWERFLVEPSVLNVQKRAIDKYFHQAKRICGELDFPHENRRAMAFAFDVAVQNWSLQVELPDTRIEHAQNLITLYGADNASIWVDEEMTMEKARLVIAAHYRAMKSNPKWRHDVFTRKCTIAMGIGKVHGKIYKLNRMF